jgi:ATP phosphoribosyltransferase regulatory subunit
MGIQEVFMKNNILHTPEGVRDIYNDECEKKMILEKKLYEVLKTYGYHQIQTPTFEYFDVFNQEYGATSARDLYKFFDREGNTLVLRPDITPSIARCAATYFQDEDVPLRFSYTGSTFINNNSYQGRLKERTQLGAELIGDGSVDGDAEMIALSVKLLQSAGLKKFQISVGHVDYLAGLFEASGIDEEMQEEIRTLILNRNFYGVDEIVGKLNLEKNLTELFGLLKSVAMDRAALEKARQTASDYKKIYQALDRLIELDTLLEYYQVSRYVSYEPALVSGLNYYTGIIFAGYTFGSGEAVVNGGRYDHLLTYFGKDAPATGFAIIVDQLFTALSRQKIQIPLTRNTRWILYTDKRREDALKDACDLRMSGEKVELMKVTESRPKEIYEASARRSGIQDLIYYLG